MGKRKRNRKKKYYFMDDLSDGNSSENQRKGKKGKKKGKGSSTPPKNRTATKNYGSTHSSSSSSSGSSNWNTAKKQPVQNPENVVRTDKGVYEFVTSKAWGTILVPVNDPSSIKVTYDEINGIDLPENFSRVPAHLWARWVKLCFHFCPDKTARSHYSSSTYHNSYTSSTNRCWNAIEKRYEEYRWEGSKRVPCTPQLPKELRQDNGPHGDEHRPMGFYDKSTATGKGRVSESGDLEVSMIFARKAPNYDEWRIFVPKQKVSGGSVDADLSELCDIETGEIFDGIPTGWAHAGSSHSHNTMGAFFSPTDDRSELGVPGLHIVVGNIDKNKLTYTYKASIVLRQLRKKLDIEEVVDTTPDEDLEFQFHPEVLNMVTSKSFFGGPLVPSKTKSTSSTGSSKKTKEDDDWDGYWKARQGFIADEEDEDDIICSPHYVAWRKRRNQKNKDNKPTKTIGDSDNGTSGDDDDRCWTDGTDGDYDSLQLPMNEAFENSDDEAVQGWGLDKIISQYEKQIHKTPLQDDTQWHGLKE